jgi:hypothetical protein
MPGENRSCDLVPRTYSADGRLRRDFATHLSLGEGPQTTPSRPPAQVASVEDSDLTSTTIVTPP